MDEEVMAQIKPIKCGSVTMNINFIPGDVDFDKEEKMRIVLLDGSEFEFIGKIDANGNVTTIHDFKQIKIGDDCRALLK